MMILWILETSLERAIASRFIPVHIDAQGCIRASKRLGIVTAVFEEAIGRRVDKNSAMSAEPHAVDTDETARVSRRAPFDSLHSGHVLIVHAHVG